MTVNSELKVGQQLLVEVECVFEGGVVVTSPQLRARGALLAPDDSPQSQAVLNSRDNCLANPLTLINDHPYANLQDYEQHLASDVPDCILSGWNTAQATGNSVAIGNRKGKLVQEILEKARNRKCARYSKWRSSERSSVVVDVMPSSDNGMTPGGHGRQAKMLAAHRIKNHVQCLNNTRGSPLPAAQDVGGAGGRAKVHRKRKTTVFRNKVEVQTPESRNKAVEKQLELEARVTRQQSAAKVQSSVSRAVSWTPTLGYRDKPVTSTQHRNRQHRNGASRRLSLTTSHSKHNRHNRFTGLRNFTIDITKLGVTPSSKTSHYSSSSSSSSEGEEDSSDQSWSPPPSPLCAADSSSEQSSETTSD